MGDRGNALLRFFDRYLGIPAVFLAGLSVRKKPPPQKEEIRSLAILAIAAIGDTVLISAILKDLMANYPGRVITVFCSQGNHSAFTLCMGNTVNLVSIPVRKPLKAINIIRQKHYDVFIDFGPWPRLNSLLTYASKSQCTIGFRSHGQYRDYVYNIPVEHRRDCHEIDNHRRLIVPLGIESRSFPFLGQADPDKNQPYIVVHMFPSGYKARYKEWSDKNWCKLLNGLTVQGYRVILTGGEADKKACRRISGSCNLTNLLEVRAAETNLIQLGELLKRATVVVSVNTGVMHMAAAYNQHLVALHGPTSVTRWGPLCQSAINFTSTSRSAGCLYLGFEYDLLDKHSLDTIDPENVLEAVLEIIKTLHK